MQMKLYKDDAVLQALLVAQGNIYCILKQSYTARLNRRYPTLKYRPIDQQRLLTRLIAELQMGHHMYPEGWSYFPGDLHRELCFVHHGQFCGL
jgi:hypothetical protein